MKPLKPIISETGARYENVGDGNIKGKNLSPDTSKQIKENTHKHQ